MADKIIKADQGRSSSRGWPRAVGLFAIVLATSIMHPGVLIALPLLLLIAAHGLRGFQGVLAAVLCIMVLASGMRDGVWFAERAWALLVGGGFLGLTILVPTWTLSSRALGAVMGAAGVGAIMMAIRPEAWVILDATIVDGIQAGVDATLDGLTLLAGSEALSPEILTTFQGAVEAQASVFPALVFLESMAALGVAWWVRTRFVGEGDLGLGPLHEFSFNDHLVWVLVAGLILVFMQFGEAFARVGSNAVVFMGGLYAMRGTAVFLFITGGFSLFGFVMFSLGVFLAAPLVLGIAVLVGVGDTWLDLRSRVRERAA